MVFEHKSSHLEIIFTSNKAYCLICCIHLVKVTQLEDKLIQPLLLMSKYVGRVPVHFLASLSPGSPTLAQLSSSSWSACSQSSEAAQVATTSSLLLTTSLTQSPLFSNSLDHPGIRDIRFRYDVKNMYTMSLPKEFTEKTTISGGWGVLWIGAARVSPNNWPIKSWHKWDLMGFQKTI